MTDHTDLASVIILSALILLLVMGTVILLLIVVHQRRIRHRAELAELANRHSAEVRQAEREVEAQTLQQVGVELHDNVGQLLTSLGIDLEQLSDEGDNARLVRNMTGTLDRAVSETRRLSASLNTDHLRSQPLQTLIRTECQRLDLPGHRSVQFTTMAEPIHVGATEHVVLFRIFQEAMNNALKHARASSISVSLLNGSSLRLTITDNGKGFDTGNRTEGQGLANIRRRAALIGATCTLVSEPGNGTMLTIER